MRHRRRREGARTSSRAPSPALSGAVLDAQCSAQDDGFLTVDEDPALDMPLDGSRQDDVLDIPAHHHQALGAMAVTDTLDRLLDNRSLVEVLSHIMSGGADNLDTALVGLLVRLRTLEARQKRMMNVDAVLIQVAA
ncbi:exported hypothetical protein [uncultured Defluviicoccus sp.]|uniref:Uncharacterized protein n=1 Tax=metagenome TaxID=256318 RepID=A0A380TCT0_9ZZZZ|nr:exported hypothetical protein [uncultured Defluviicoccus sp.]